MADNARHGEPQVVTRNVRDLDFAGATAVNPWNG